jgi:hypothetical protein
MPGLVKIGQLVQTIRRGDVRRDRVSPELIFSPRGGRKEGEVKVLT